MKITEIKTTQNVVLQYELADLRERIVAFLIDFACLIAGLGILIAVLANVFSASSMDVILYLALAVYIFYSLAFETLNHGQTPGKMAMRIQVVKTTSGEPAFSDYAARWAFRLVDIYLSLGGIASILIASSSRSQRLGDIVANTTVIKLIPKMNLDLKDILGIHGQDAYQPHYVQAKQLMEEDALLIKATLDRYRRYQNAAHQEALGLLAKKVTAILRVSAPQSDDERFLETVLKDYVILTR